MGVVDSERTYNPSPTAEAVWIGNGEYQSEMKEARRLMDASVAKHGEIRFDGMESESAVKAVNWIRSERRRLANKAFMRTPAF